MNPTFTMEPGALVNELVQYGRAAVHPSYGRTMTRRPSSRGPIDTYLDTLGLYRLKVPPQEPLFRIVAEQLCFTQTEYPRFKKMTCDRLLLKKEEFAQHVSEPMEEHVLKLQEGRASAGVAEMMALADITRYDFLLYREIEAPPTNVTRRGFAHCIRVAGGEAHHYDLVISKQEATDRAMLQSLVYQQLYASVYNLHNVQHAVEKMLYDKEYARTRKESLCSQDGALAAVISKMADSPEQDASSGSAEGRASAGLYATSDDEPCDVLEILDRNMVPFPYKTAKALDGTHYRNLPQDVWTELVKERRREQQRPDSNGFLAGIQCLVELSGVLAAAELARLESQARPEHRHLSETGGNLYVAHIQEMQPNQGPVCCYVMSLGKKLTVPYDCLRPLCSTPVPCPVSPAPGGVRARTPGRRRSRHSTSERSSCGGERHLSHTDSTCSTPQDLGGWSGPTFMVGEPPAGLMSPVALAPGQLAGADGAPLLHPSLLHVQPPAGAALTQHGLHLVGSPVVSPQFLPPALAAAAAAAAAAGLDSRFQALSMSGGAVSLPLPLPVSAGGGGGGAEMPPVAPVIMSTSVHGAPPPPPPGPQPPQYAGCADPEPPPAAAVYPAPAGWQLVPGGGGGGPPLMLSPAAGGLLPPPHVPAPYQPLRGQPPQHAYGPYPPPMHAYEQARLGGGGGASVPMPSSGGGLYPLEVLSPPAMFPALPESPGDQHAAFYSPGSAEESGYRSRNASHSSSNSMDGSIGDGGSPHVRNGGLRRGRPPMRPTKPPQPPRNLPPRLSKFSEPPPGGPAPPAGPPLIYGVPPGALFYPPQSPQVSGGSAPAAPAPDRILVADGSGGFFLAPVASPLLAPAAPGAAVPPVAGPYLYLPPALYPPPGGVQCVPGPAQLVQYQQAMAAAAAAAAAAQPQYASPPPMPGPAPAHCRRGPAQ